MKIGGRKGGGVGGEGSKVARLSERGSIPVSFRVSFRRREQPATRWIFYPPRRREGEEERNALDAISVDTVSSLSSFGHQKPRRLRRFLSDHRSLGFRGSVENKFSGNGFKYYNNLISKGHAR